MRIVKLGKANVLHGRCLFCDTEFEFFRSETHCTLDPEGSMENVYTIPCPACGKIYKLPLVGDDQCT